MKFKASCYCAFTIALAFVAFGFIDSPEPVDLSWSLIVGMAMTAGFLWPPSFCVCIVLLVPLVPLFMRGSLFFSFTVFILVGFSVAGLLGLWICQILAGGGASLLFDAGSSRAFLFPGVLGMLGAASAWLSLKQDTTGVAGVGGVSNKTMEPTQ